MAVSNAEMEMQEFTFPDEKETGKDTPVQMEDTPQDVEFSVVDDTPEEDRGRKPMTDPPPEPTEEELQQYSQDVQKRIKHFTKGYHDERRAKEAAARERDEALRYAQSIVEENKKLKGSLNEGHNALVAQTKASLEAEVTAAKQALRDAHESFDPDQIAEAQDKLLDAKIKLDRVNDFRTTSVQEDKPEVQTSKAEPQRPAPDKKALAWNQRNPWFGTDPEMTAFTLGLHQKLVASGINPTSDEYYERIDARVRKLFPEQFEADEAQPKPSKSPVAPASRSTAPKKIVLTQSQVSIARKLGVSLQEYAKQVALEQRNQNV